MKKLILLITMCILFSNSFIFAKDYKKSGNEKFNASVKDLISCHIEFAKISIDKKCEKLKKKIRKCEEQLHYTETNSNQFDSIELERINKRRSYLLGKIQKYEDRIYNLKLLRSSSEIVDFTDL